MRGSAAVEVPVGGGGARRRLVVGVVGGVKHGEVIPCGLVDRRGRGGRQVVSMVCLGMGARSGPKDADGVWGTQPGRGGGIAMPYGAKNPM